MNNVAMNQAYLFMIFIVNGIIIGILFDIFRILRKSFHTPNIVTYIEDTLFWIISALLVIYTLFIFNHGEIRLYIFIGIFLGITLYMLFFSKTIVKVSVKIITFLKEIICRIFTVLVSPFIKIFQVLKKFVSSLYQFLFHFVKKCKKNRSKLEKP